MAVSITLKMRVFSFAEIKSIGTSLKGASLDFNSFHNHGLYLFVFRPYPTYLQAAQFLSLSGCQAINAQILGCDPFFCIEQQKTNISFINSLNSTDHGIKLKVFMNFCFAPDTSRIDQDKLFWKSL